MLKNYFFLTLIFQEGTDLGVAAERKEQRYRQPYLMKRNKRFFLVMDQKVLVAGDSFVESFDRLFKAHFCFNVHYAQVLEPFYEYVAAYIYGVLPYSPQCAVPIHPRVRVNRDSQIFLNIHNI